MSPADARALIGRTLALTMRGANADSLRFKVQGISGGDVFRLQSVRNAVNSRAHIAEVDLAIRRGHLRIEE